MVCSRQSNSSVICQCYFMLSWVWINFIPGNNYWRLTFFFFQSSQSSHLKQFIVHCSAYIQYRFQDMSAAQSRRHPTPRERQLFAEDFAGRTLPQLKTMPRLSSGSINTSPDPGELWLRAFTLPGQASQTVRRGGRQIKPHTFPHYRHKECQPHQWRVEGVGAESDQTLTVPFGLRIGMRQVGGAASHASTVKEADRCEALHLSLTCWCHSNPRYL